MDYSTSDGSPVPESLFPWFSALDLEGSPEPVRHISDCGFHNLVVLVRYDDTISP